MKTNIIGEGAQYTVETLHLIVYLQQKLNSSQFTVETLQWKFQLLETLQYSRFTVVETLQQSIYSYCRNFTGSIDGRNFTVVNLQQKLYSSQCTVETLQQKLYSGNVTVVNLQQKFHSGNFTAGRLQKQLTIETLQKLTVQLEITVVFKYHSKF